MNAALIRSVRDRASVAAYRSLVYDWSLGRRPDGHILVHPGDPWPGDPEAGRWFCAQECGAEDFGGGSAAHRFWTGRGGDPLHLAHMQSFEWLRDMRATGLDQSRPVARALIAAWIDLYWRWEEFAWRPDTVGRRLISWLALYDYFAGSAMPAFQDRFTASIIRQGKHLSRILPGDLHGLPLLQASAGLLFAGLCIEGHEDWITQALEFLAEETDRQVLPDGGHVSRSPRQALAVMRLLSDTRRCIVAAGLPAPEFIVLALDRLAQALRFFRHADRGLMLLGGACEGGEDIIDMALAQTGDKAKILRSLPDSGYERLSQGRSLLFMDVGCPPAFPYDGDAHAAPLAIEFSFARDRIFTACGTHAGSSRWSSALRATAAHSTLSLDYRDACEIGPDGHIGRRPMAVTTMRDETSGAALIDAVHDGYVPLNGMMHRRRLYLSDRGQDLRGEDTLTCTTGLTRPVDAHVRFHLHPRVSVSLVKNNEEALLRLPGGSFWRFHQSGGNLALEDSIHIDEGQQIRRTSQIVVAGRMDGDFAQIRWALQREKA